MMNHNARYQRTRRRQFNQAWNMRLALQSLHCSGTRRQQQKAWTVNPGRHDRDL